MTSATWNLGNAVGTATVRRRGKGPGTGLAEVAETLRVWHRRHADRRALVALDDRMLADIGIDRIDALQEASKPFWKP